MRRQAKQEKALGLDYTQNTGKKKASRGVGLTFWRHQGLVATVGSSGVLVKVLFSVRIILIIVPIDIIVIFFQVLLFNF